MAVSSQPSLVPKLLELAHRFAQYSIAQLLKDVSLKVYGGELPYMSFTRKVLELALKFAQGLSSSRTMPPSRTKGDGLFWVVYIRMSEMNPELYCFCTLFLFKDSFVQAQGSVLCWKLYRGEPRAQHVARSFSMASPCQCGYSRYFTLSSL